MGSSILFNCLDTKREVRLYIVTKEHQSKTLETCTHTPSVPIFAIFESFTLLGALPPYVYNGMVRLSHCWSGCFSVFKNPSSDAGLQEWWHLVRFQRIATANAPQPLWVSTRHEPLFVMVAGTDPLTGFQLTKMKNPSKFRHETSMGSH